MWHVSNKTHWLTMTLLVATTGAALAASRTWTDATGAFSVKAELISVDSAKVSLRREDGRQIDVPLQSLSEKDQAFIKAQRNSSKKDAGIEQIAKLAKDFFSNLRGDDRTEARSLLTLKAQPLMKGADSPLAKLPAPSAGSSAIRAGKVEVDGGNAVLPVRVRSGSASHQTKLHFRRDGDEWRIFAISATYPDGEKSINFEAELAKAAGAPAGSMIGKPMPLDGYTTTGQRLDMANYRGKVVLVDFWATWCGPCRAEMPNILDNWNKYHKQGFEVIAISVDQDLAALQGFLAQEQPPWTVVADNHPNNANKMAAKYGIRGIPAFYLVGPDGTVVARNCRGPRLGAELQKLMQNRP